MFLKLDGTFWIQLINFVIFYALLNVVFLRPVRRAISARRKFIDAIQADYEQAMHDIANLKSSGDAQRLANRRAIEEHFAQMRAEAGNEAVLINTRASALAHDRTVKAQAVVASEMETASHRVDALADELADSLLGRVLGAS